MPNLVHHGIVFVPLGAHPNLNIVDEVVGGCAWGAGCISGNDGSRIVMII
jgi:NAD(P)H dehydrogenase (quinone)